ncbi:RodZ domain-containing protein [Bacillus sp. EAC]|uniref:helix-turn-helix domain-containing protein n=1 Tax=Bacillus sp. EAC TaxID=1978338 RepID=UPI000B44B4B8|nr:RodZ domain-containing protein [Bacillus sp. EAC]
MTELGKILREAREAKNLSIDDVQELTKIQKRYLEAIESGNYDILPGQFYVRAFIRQYAETVGVDVSSLLIEKPAVEESSESSAIPDEVKHEEIPSRATKLKEPLGVNVKSSRIMDYLPKILIAILIIGICIAIYMMFPSKNKTNNSTNTNQSNASSEIEKPENNALDQAKDDQKDTEVPKDEDTKVEPTQKITVDSAEGKRTTVSLTGTDVFKLEVISNGESYVDIKNPSGKMFYSGILKQGQTQSFDFTDENEVTVNIGASHNVELHINDEVFQFPVSPTEAVHQYITIKNLKMNQ